MSNDRLVRPPLPEREWYPDTAVRRVQERLSLSVDGIAGPKTLSAVEALLARVQSDDTQEHEPVPRWLHAARRHIGVLEQPGGEHEDLILRWLATTSLGRWGRSRDETPWCSAFVNAMIEAAGLEGTSSAMARSWLGWGLPCPPRVGAVVVFPRGDPPSGHVAFVDGVRGALIEALGGNQGNSVSVVERRVDEALGFRWPAEDLT